MHRCSQDERQGGRAVLGCPEEGRSCLSLHPSSLPPSLCSAASYSQVNIQSEVTEVLRCRGEHGWGCSASSQNWPLQQNGIMAKTESRAEMPLAVSWSPLTGHKAAQADLTCQRLGSDLPELLKCFFFPQWLSQQSWGGE